MRLVLTALVHYRPSNGGSRIRTYVDTMSTDLQSAAFSHSAIPPKRLPYPYKTSQTLSILTESNFTLDADLV